LSSKLFNFSLFLISFLSLPFTFSFPSFFTSFSYRPNCYFPIPKQAKHTTNSDPVHCIEYWCSLYMHPTIRFLVKCFNSHDKNNRHFPPTGARNYVHYSLPLSCGWTWNFSSSKNVMLKFPSA
jgi:hypothetical protein